ncbi:alpha/beta fold hydrolase [Microbacterium sp. CJ88]|uniref:alpha/beta hydrolase n=1 Tax=Microbacterium sp. CJ88 TaxID=3445672 RepID=UPI003F65DC76
MTTELRAIRLADGRGLAWREYGDPDGLPCLYLSGTPASSLAGAAFDDLARAERVRWISVDKPGYGASDFDPRRTLLRAGDESRQLADALGLDRIAVVGESGGGPFALATAYVMQEKITTAVVACGLAPWGAGLDVQAMSPALRFMMRAARSAPWLLPPLLNTMRRRLARPDAATAGLEKSLETAVPAERYAPEVRRTALATLPAILDALGGGPRAAVQELRIVTHDWGFERSAIRCHVDIIHGELDTNVPVSSAHSNAAAIPDSTLELFPDLAHAASSVQAPRILRLVAAASAAR